MFEAICTWAETITGAEKSAHSASERFEAIARCRRAGPNFAAGTPVRVTWDASKATIIPAAAL